MGLLGAVIGLAVGAGIGALTIFAFGANAGIGFVALGGICLLCVVGYIVGNATSNSTSGVLTRCMLVGFNAGLNGALGIAVYGAVLGVGGTIMALVVALLNLMAIFNVVSTSEVYQGILGWANWLLPMSWLIVGLGFLFLVLNVVGHLTGYLIFKGQSFRMHGLDVDWKTGTIFQRGGWVSNANPIDTAFNMGNFALVDNLSSSWHIEHEAGHTLNLAAFGSAFHLIGAIDENVTGGGANAFSERIAESNDPATGQSNIIPMWI